MFNVFLKVLLGNSILHRSLFLVFLILAFLSRPLAQKSSESVTYKILGISVEGNNPKTGAESGAIINNSGLKVGQEVTLPGDQLRQAIQRLWALHIFSDVQILIDTKVENGVYLSIKVAEYPRLGSIEVNGADDVSKDDVLKKVNIVVGQVITPNDIKIIAEKIRNLYSDEGHLLAKIAPETKPEIDTAKTNKVRLIVNIEEGPSVHIDHIYFKGNQAFKEDDLKGELDDTKEPSFWIFRWHPKLDKKKFAADKKKIVKFYHNHGYLDADVVGDSTWYSADKKKINILITVQEGGQYSIRSISWDGATVYKPEYLTSVLAIKPGDIYNEERFEQNLRGNSDQTDVASLYLDNGYLMFNLDPEINRVGKDSLDIIVHVYERNKFVLGKVDIKGNTKTKDYVIRRELYTRPGDYFNRSAIIRSLRQLSQLNYFNPEKLKPEPHPLNDNKTVDLTYEVEEKSSDNVNASVGYSQAYGATGALGFTLNNFSIANPLEGGAGQIFTFQWQFGEGSRYRTFTVGFTEPWLYNTPTLLGVSLFDTRQTIIADYQQTGISLRVGRGHLKWLDDLMRIDYTLRFQNNDIHDNYGNQFYRVGRTTQYSINQTISRNSTDSPIFPSSGSLVSLSTEISGPPVLPGNVDYHKWLFDADWFTPMFGTSKMVLYTSSQFGYIAGFKSDTTIPPLEYFYMGGTGLTYVQTTPLRGYDDQSVGPRNELGILIPGRVMVKHTVELRFAVTLNPIPIYVLGFAEGGNIFQDFSRADLFNLKKSYGFGARLLINPIGMVGFDYGYGADPIYPRLNEPSGWHFHFQFGKGF
ncbi:MAG: outer membrane protein assembly factor BamA [Bacteroidota bacterium]